MIEYYCKYIKGFPIPCQRVEARGGEGDIQIGLIKLVSSKLVLKFDTGFYRYQQEFLLVIPFWKRKGLSISILHKILVGS